jgi:uncharacterized protein (TIGR02444 family)
MSGVESPAPGSPFWRFSLRFYRQPAVADACIALQDEAGVDVNLLLFLLWQAMGKRALSANEVEELERGVGPWREAAVIPLRRMRRALKSSPPDLLSSAETELFRTRIKAVELEAERLQQEALHGLARADAFGDEVASAAQAARRNVAAYQHICSKPFPQTAVATLLEALSGLERKPEE